MAYNKDCLFNFVKSLPALGHSEAIVYRQLGSVYKQPLNYIPDYGGVVETPNISLKRHSLIEALPFDCNPKVQSLTTGCNNKPHPQFVSQDCLFVRSTAESENGGQLNIVKAVGKDIYLNLIQEDFISGTYAAIQQENVSYHQYIAGIKFSPAIPDLLLVKFDNCIKTIKLDEHDIDGTLRGSNHYGTYIEKRGLKIQDASMNFATKSLLAVGSESTSVCQVKLYDLIQSNYLKQPCYTITWPSDHSTATIICDRAGYFNGKQVRGNVLKTYVPQNLGLGFKQLDNIPSHIANLLVTTICKTMLIDPRTDKVGQVYVDKTKMSNFHPIEYIKRTEFSHRNTYQFYSLTNLNLRVYDSRYLGMPMNQVSHMLISTRTDPMNMRVLEGDSGPIETLCLTLQDRLCFLAFDQSQKTDIINPQSIHMPYHSALQDTIPMDRVENIFGLAIAQYNNSKRGGFFSVLQLDNQGDIFMRDFERKQEAHPMELEEASYQKGCKFIESNRLNVDSFRQQTRDMREVAINKFRFNDTGEASFNILDQEVDYESGITSTRALERSKKTRSILNKYIR